MLAKVLQLFFFLKSRRNTISFKGILFALLFSKKSSLSNADILFYCHDNSRTTILNGLWYSPILDCINQYFIKKNISRTITLAAPFSSKFGRNCFGNVVMYNRPLLFAYIKRFIISKNNKVMNLDEDPVILFWLSVLVHIKPQVVLGINPPVELCLAARKKQIWIADVQHGVLANGNYYDIRKRESINQMGWPNAILCWDEFSKLFISNKFSKYTNSYVIGNPAFYNHSLRNLPEIGTINSNKVSILVTLQHSFEFELKSDINFQEIGIPTHLVSFILNHGMQYNWYLKLHPSIFNNARFKYYKKFNSIFKGKSNIDWVKCNSVHLHTILEICNVHVTYNSASVRDASLFGLKSCVLDKNILRVQSYFADLFKNGMVTIQNPEDCIGFDKWIVQASKDKNSKVEINESSAFYNLEKIIHADSRSSNNLNIKL